MIVFKYKFIDKHSEVATNELQHVSENLNFLYVSMSHPQPNNKEGYKMIEHILTKILGLILLGCFLFVAFKLFDKFEAFAVNVYEKTKQRLLKNARP
jgi:hypothetical protein